MKDKYIAVFKFSDIDDTLDIESQINEFLEHNNSKLVDVKITSIAAIRQVWYTIIYYIVD